MICCYGKTSSPHFPFPSRPQSYLLRYGGGLNETCKFPENDFVTEDRGCFYLVGGAWLTGGCRTGLSRQSIQMVLETNSRTD